MSCAWYSASNSMPEMPNFARDNLSKKKDKANKAQTTDIQGSTKHSWSTVVLTLSLFVKAKTAHQLSWGCTILLVDSKNYVGKLAAQNYRDLHAACMQTN